MTYLLCHGFGFTDDYWKNLIPFLDDKYEFWNEDIQKNSTESYVGIGHSIGFLKLNNSIIKFKALVGLQGFLNFCGIDPKQKIVRIKNLDRMMEACAKDSQKFLRFFYKVCGYPERVPHENSSEKLIADLKMMKLSYPHCGVPTLIIGSHEDKIVEPSILEDDFGKDRMIKVDYIDGVLHNLGYSMPKETFEMIKNFLKEHIDG